MMTKPVHWFISRFFLPDCSDYNPLSVRRACRSKRQARSAFKANHLPYAKGRVFFNPAKAFAFVKSAGFPVVVKPNVGGFSRGAYFPIHSKTALLKAVLGVKKYWPVSVVEQYLSGKNYRIVITKFGVMSVLRRYPPFVIGDGVQTISALIDVENALRRDRQLMPVTRLIPKNSAIKKHLKQQNKSLATVLDAGHKVELHHKIALKLGASVEVLDKRVLNQNNSKKLKQILDFFDANILGIDVICQQGLEIDFEAQNCIFLELNARPFLKMHDKPRYGKAEELSHFYQQLDALHITDNEKYY